MSKPVIVRFKEFKLLELDEVSFDEANADRQLDLFGELTDVFNENGDIEVYAELYQSKTNPETIYAFYPNYCFKTKTGYNFVIKMQLV